MSEYPISGDNTTFEEIYDRFLGKIQDDMYFEWTKEDTVKDMKNILLDAIPAFEFPRFPLYDFDTDAETYNCHLTSEEINIFALLMYNAWLQRQVASVENTRQKYSGSIWPTYLATGKLNSRKNGKAEKLIRAEVFV